MIRAGAGEGEWGRRGGRSCLKLTLSGTQENFSEIINGTPSIAAKEEKKRGNGIADTANVQHLEILTQTVQAGQGWSRPTRAQVSGAEGNGCPGTIPAPGKDTHLVSEADAPPKCRRAVRAGKGPEPTRGPACKRWEPPKGWWQDRGARGLRGEGRAGRGGGQ